jgi:hypothetical protein
MEALFVCRSLYKLLSYIVQHVHDLMHFDVLKPPPKWGP